jgi:phosphoribosyl 1,2-cyclic phosphodiesterase
MSLYISSLNSGSNGNCYYIGNEQEAILVDAGISCRETEKRMKRSGLSIDKVKAIFISHEHGDHIAGVNVLANKFNLPVYITPATAKHARLLIDHSFRKTFEPFKPIQIGNLSVIAFPKFHDAINPHSFIVQHASVTVGIFTDLGRVCKELTDHFKLCDAAFLEANYDVAMLENGHYPIHLKNRIRGGEGHLSNDEAYQLFQQHKPEKLKYLLLSHLSKNNNKPELVQTLFSQNAGDTEIIIASRYQETAVYHVTGNGDTSMPRHVSMKKAIKHQSQLSLF